MYSSQMYSSRLYILSKTDTSCESEKLCIGDSFPKACHVEYLFTHREELYMISISEMVYNDPPLLWKIVRTNARKCDEAKAAGDDDDDDDCKKVEFRDDSSSCHRQRKSYEAVLVGTLPGPWRHDTMTIYLETGIILMAGGMTLQKQIQTRVDAYHVDTGDAWRLPDLPYSIAYGQALEWPSQGFVVFAGGIKSCTSRVTPKSNLRTFCAPVRAMKGKQKSRKNPLDDHPWYLAQEANESILISSKRADVPMWSSEVSWTSLTTSPLPYCGVAPLSVPGVENSLIMLGGIERQEQTKANEMTNIPSQYTFCISFSESALMDSAFITKKFLSR